MSYDDPAYGVPFSPRRTGFLLRSLMQHEQQHNMASADFYARYERGELGDSAEFVEWAGDYQHYLQLKEELEQGLASVHPSIEQLLDEVRYVRQRTS